MAAGLARRGCRTLDVEYRQVVFDFFEDVDYIWDHWLLIVNGEPAVWVAASPTRGVAVLKLREHQVIPLTRSSGFPVEYRNHVFMFDPIDVSSMGSLVERAEALAAVVGFTQHYAAGGGDGLWHVSGTAIASFGEIVRQAALEVATTVRRGPVGLVQFVGDPRIACHDVENGSSFITESRAVSCWSTSEKPKNHPPHGPLLARELVLQLQSTSLSLPQYDANRRLRSGVAENGVDARMHTALCEVSGWMVTETSASSPWVATLQGSQAQMLKLKRLLREERTQKTKRRSDKSNGGGGGKNQQGEAA
jgi:hypothetical protein